MLGAALGVLGKVGSAIGIGKGIIDTFSGYTPGEKSAQGMFNAQMDTSIQRRVEDAKKAGVHPLFALGANVGSSPVSTFGGRERGSLDRAVRSALERQSLQGQNRLIDSQVKRNEAEAALFESEAARITQQGASRGRDMVEFVGPPIQASAEPGTVRTPVETKQAKRKGFQAGRQQSTMEIEMPGLGVPQNVPASQEVAEAMEIGQLLSYYGLTGKARLEFLKQVLRRAGGWSKKFTPPGVFRSRRRK